MDGPLANWQLPPGVTRAVWDYAHSETLAQAYERTLADSGLARVDLCFAERHFEGPGRLVDLGCGTGRLLLLFARRGWWAVGVDLSVEMLRVARARAADAGLTVHLLAANLVELDALADKCFDHAACLFSTLGMISGAGHRQRFLGHVRRILRPGGKVVLHVHNRWFNLWDRSGRRWLLGDWFGPRTGDRPMPPHEGVSGLALHHFTRREAGRLLHAADLRVLEIVPVGLADDGRLQKPWLFTPLRAYGYLIAAQRPS